MVEKEMPAKTTAAGTARSTRVNVWRSDRLELRNRLLIRFSPSDTSAIASSDLDRALHPCRRVRQVRDNPGDCYDRPIQTQWASSAKFLAICQFLWQRMSVMPFAPANDATPAREPRLSDSELMRGLLAKSCRMSARHSFDGSTDRSTSRATTMPAATASIGAHRLRRGAQLPHEHG